MCLVKWCTDEASRFKIDYRKEEKEWNNPTPLNTFVNKEIIQLHIAASTVLLFLSHSQGMRLNIAYSL